ncbi:MAG: helix-turn-helix transcriptional regulator [Clostridia bacterium]|nr:helix-turn-helix transcriptional regulator [Clostridia bacterium]
MDFVKNILNIAKEQGYSNKQLCELLGKNPSYITDWKNGKSKPKADEIIILADTFGVSTDYLLGKTDTQHSPTPEQYDELLKGLNQLTPEQIKQVRNYVDFIASQKNN